MFDEERSGEDKHMYMINEQFVCTLCRSCFHTDPQKIERCAEGIGNYVFKVVYPDIKYIVRCSSVQNAYTDTIEWLDQLQKIGIPTSKVIRHGRFQNVEYLVLTYLEGVDLGLVYPKLTQNEKHKIAKKVVQIQQAAASLKVSGIPADWIWRDFVQDMLDRAEVRIMQNGYFDVNKVEQLRNEMEKLEVYFYKIEPVPYLDDISSKNMLIHNGQVSGVIDIDWIGVGDWLTFAALTHMALLNLEQDTDYVDMLLEEMQITDIQYKAFLFYTLMYCVDFMGERGMTFGDKTVPVDSKIIDRLNSIFDALWMEWIQYER